ncbi:kinase-like protein [Athelia psychrophila]|uniref:Kinase-like protein n=1 Tax=Athelia psychrophila TaxID=1759441 RepID=A0A166MBX1_9AGAM|nr:kinase-like protein [Fibularhizoctonia sp. CBS 109695]
MDDPVKQSKLRTRLRRELCVWQRLKHKNVLVLYGTAANFGQYPSFVCPWLENGNISKYLKARADDLGMAGRLQLLCEVAAGLSYLHASGVVHGDLTGANILITDDGSACLCDFGLSSVAAEFQGTSYITSTIGGNWRWAAPELYNIAEDGAVPMVSTHSDSYSYGSVTLEILSGQIPFAYLRDAQVIMEVYRGKKARRPQDAPHVTDQLWAFVNQCWVEPPTARPSAEQLVQSIQRFLNEIS